MDRCLVCSLRILGGYFTRKMILNRWLSQTKSGPSCRHDATIQLIALNGGTGVELPFLIIITLLYSCFKIGGARLNLLPFTIPSERLCTCTTGRLAISPGIFDRRRAPSGTEQAHHAANLRRNEITTVWVFQLS